MNSRIENTRNAKVDARLREIRAAWSVDTRKRRAEIGRRRAREFMQIMQHAAADPELWAVGAPTWDDLERMRG